MNNSLSAIDLFSGAGGMSIGFSQAGFEIPFAVEKDLWASETYSLNHPKTKLLTKNICDMVDSEFEPYKGIDVVIGGPPCQGFSISASSRRRADDPRNLLYLEFLRVISIVRPQAVLIENVREITRFKLSDGRLLCDDIKARLKDLGYYSEILTLNASLFGVPQARIRAFVIACQSQEKLNQAVTNLETINKQKSDLLNSENIFTISLWDAISDLPEVQPWKVAEDAILSYATAPKNQYQKFLRGKSKTVINHVPMRHTPRMIERFQHLISNSNLHGLTLPDGLGPRTRGNPEISSDKIYDQNHRQLDPSKPSPTITASFYSSFIHPYQARNLTVREAARLQGFPDSFVFMGKRTTLSKKLLTKKGELGDLYLDQFNQVGNSVPPILAKALAEQIRNMISK